MSTRCWASTHVCTPAGHLHTPAHLRGMYTRLHIQSTLERGSCNADNSASPVEVSAKPPAPWKVGSGVGGPGPKSRALIPPERGAIRLAV